MLHKQEQKELKNKAIREKPMQKYDEVMWNHEDEIKAEIQRQMQATKRKYVWNLTK